jgi:hypothetical protein
VSRIADSARRHSVADEDMLHAVRNAVATEDLDEGLTMFIGQPGMRRCLRLASWMARTVRSSFTPWQQGVSTYGGGVIADAAVD